MAAIEYAIHERSHFSELVDLSLVSQNIIINDNLQIDPQFGELII